MALFAAAPLRTERMTLPPLAEGDRDDIWEYQRLPEVLRYIPWPERTRDEGYAHTSKRAAMRRLETDGDSVHFSMALRGEPTTDASAEASRDRVIGDVMLRISSVRNAQLEIGWVVHPDYQGRGLAAEAAGAVLDFAFEALRPHRVHAQLDARNAASARLCERLGMRLEATLREAEWDDGWQDTAVHAILRREWTGDRASG